MSNDKSPAEVAAELILDDLKIMLDDFDDFDIREMWKSSIVDIINKAFAQTLERHDRMAALVVSLNADSCFANDRPPMIQARFRDFGLSEGGFLKHEITEAAKRYEEREK